MENDNSIHKVVKFQLFILLFLGFSTVAQETKIQHDIDIINSKINATTDKERLQWLDSLCTIIKNKKAFKYDSIAALTVTYALRLDSFDLAVKTTSDLIFYKNNILYKHDEGLKIFKDFIQKGTRLNDYSSCGEFYLNGADSYYFTGDVAQAFKYYDLAEKYAIKAGDKKLAGTANLHHGFGHTVLANIAEASSKMYIARSYFTDLNDTANIIAADYGLALLFSQNGFFEEAKKIRDETITLAKAIDDKINLAILYYNAALDLQRDGLLDDCIKNLLLSIEYERKAGGNDYVYSKIICAIVVAYIENNDYDGAKVYIDEINNNIDRFRNDENKENYLEVLKHIALAERNLQHALKLGKEHLSIEVKKNRVDKVIDSEKFLAKVYRVLGQNTQAYYHENRYYRLKDSVFSRQKVKYFSFYQSLNESQAKDFRIRAQLQNLEILERKGRVKDVITLFGAILLISSFVVYFLIRARNASKKSESLSVTFSQNLITAQDAERQHLARDLHDSIGQKLVLLLKQLKLNGSDASTELCKNAIDEVRFISRGLFPPQIEGVSFTDAIKSLINEIDRISPIIFSYEIDDIDNLIAKSKEVHLYRIIQEVLSNILKHSNAKAVDILVEKKTDFIVIRIEDNGDGFDSSIVSVNKPQLGMRTLYERSNIINCKLKIDSALSRGTRIELVIPF